MASVITPRRPSDPTPDEIEARKAEIRAKRPAEFDGQPVDYEREAYLASERDRQRRRRLAEKKARAEANRNLLQRETEPVDLETGPREMTKADICNVELLRFGDVDPMLDMVVDAAAAQHVAEDLNCRRGLGGIDPELFDVSDPLPFKAQKPFKPAAAFGVVGSCVVRNDPPSRPFPTPRGGPTWLHMASGRERPYT